MHLKYDAYYNRITFYYKKQKGQVYEKGEGIINF